MKTGCARLRVAPATLNCGFSRSAGRSQGRHQPARRARAPLTASWRCGYLGYVRTLNLTISPADLTDCQNKFQLLHEVHVWLPIDTITGEADYTVDLNELGPSDIDEEAVSECYFYCPTCNDTFFELVEIGTSSHRNCFV